MRLINGGFALESANKWIKCELALLRNVSELFTVCGDKRTLNAVIIELNVHLCIHRLENVFSHAYLFISKYVEK